MRLFYIFQITVALNASRKAVVITRYYTPEEMAKKKLDQEEENKQMENGAKKITYISPTATKQLDRRALDKFLEVYDELIVKLTKCLTDSEDDLSSEDCLINISGECFISIDFDSSCVHIRNYWFDRAAQTWRPRKSKLFDVLTQLMM